MSPPGLDALTAPADPRSTWDLPVFGSMPQIAHLDEATTRVLAPNPSPMTLDGTNTYVLGIPGDGSAAVVDPGPRDDDHLARVEQVLAQRDASCELVAVTHHHVDHAEAAADWARHLRCPLAATTPAVAGPHGRLVGPDDRLVVGGLTLTAVATPGHCGDHLAYRLDTGALLTGDHILGRGTSVVVYPDGDLAAYLESLRRVLDLGPDALLPGHGPELREDPSAVTRYYLDHRAFRERQILAVLAEGPHHVRQLVARIYADVDRTLWGAAEASTRATLDKLEREDRIAFEAAGTARLQS